MTAIDAYVRRVMEQVPPALPEWDRIGQDLRAHLQETVEAEGDERAAIRRMGSPEAVARGYLAEVAMSYASVPSRILAFVLDLALGLMVLLLVGGTLAGLAALVGGMRAMNGGQWASIGGSVSILSAVIFVVCLGLLSVAYFPLMEWRVGQTLGKRLVGIHVVREDGRRIGLGQAIVRRIPFFLEFFWIDAVVALFTERHQRAFDLVARTVVTRVGPGTVAAPDPVRQSA